MAEASGHRKALEFRLLGPDLETGLSELFRAFAQGQDHAFFHPHPMTDEEAKRLCGYRGRDLYYAACMGTAVLAYGLLRGWDEGYEIPPSIPRHVVKVWRVRSWRFCTRPPRPVARPRFA